MNGDTMLNFLFLFQFFRFEISAAFRPGTSSGLINKTANRLMLTSAASIIPKLDDSRKAPKKNQNQCGNV